MAGGGGVGGGGGAGGCFLHMTDIVARFSSIHRERSRVQVLVCLRVFVCIHVCVFSFNCSCLLKLCR